MSKQSQMSQFFTIKLGWLQVFHNCLNCALEICDHCDLRNRDAFTFSQLLELSYGNCYSCEMPSHSFSHNVNFLSIIKIPTVGYGCWIRDWLVVHLSVKMWDVIKHFSIIIVYSWFETTSKRTPQYVNRWMTYFRFTFRYRPMQMGITVPNLVSDCCYCQKSSLFFPNRTLLTTSINVLYQTNYFSTISQQIFSLLISIVLEIPIAFKKLSTPKSHNLFLWNGDDFKFSTIVTIFISKLRQF